jgi:phage terminase large subunit GpA-like protein
MIATPTSLPAPVILLIATVDVQVRYLACMVTGWALDGQAFVLDVDTLDGDPRDPATFHALMQGLAALQVEHPTFGPMPVHLVGVDAGFCADDVYRAVRSAPRPRWCYATKGEAGHLGDPIILPRVDLRDGAGRRAGYRPVRINTDGCKTELMAALKLPRGQRGAWQFSRTLRDNTEFLAQMQSEEVKPRVNAAGVEVGRVWEKVRERNEAWDLAVLALALWHFVTDRALLQHCEQLMGPEEARRQWSATYPSGRRY